MKILHVMPYCPVPADYGAKLRIFNLMRHLSRNHDVTAVFIGEERHAAALRHEFGGRLGRIIACRPQAARKIRGFAHVCAFLGEHSILYQLGENWELRSKVHRELASAPYDVVLTEFPHMAFFDLPPGPLKVLDSHNIEHDNFRRMAEKSESRLERFIYRNETRKFFREEVDAFRRQDLLLFTSERDRRMAHEDAPAIPSTVVPNGVDCAYFTPADSAQEPCSMVFTGIMGYVPNADGVAWFLDEIFPRILSREPRAKVTIVGSGPGREMLKRASDNVRITGYVPDVRPYVHAAQVTIVPLRMGGGTRLKILESMAMRSPVVSTSIGAEGIELEPGRHALVADDPQAFADAVLRLFGDAALRGTLEANGIALVRKRYDWSVVGAGLEQALQHAMAGAGHREDGDVR